MPKQGGYQTVNIPCQFCKLHFQLRRSETFEVVALNYLSKFYLYVAPRTDCFTLWNSTKTSTSRVYFSFPSWEGLKHLEVPNLVYQVEKPRHDMNFHYLIKKIKQNNIEKMIQLKSPNATVILGKVRQLIVDNRWEILLFANEIIFTDVISNSEKRRVYNMNK